MGTEASVPMMLSWRHTNSLPGGEVFAPGASMRNNRVSTCGSSLFAFIAARRKLVNSYSGSRAWLGSHTAIRASTGSMSASFGVVCAPSGMDSANAAITRFLIYKCQGPRIGRHSRRSAAGLFSIRCRSGSHWIFVLVRIEISPR